VASKIVNREGHHTYGRTSGLWRVVSAQQQTADSHLTQQIRSLLHDAWTCLLHLMPAQGPDQQQVATPLKHSKPVDGGVNRNGGFWCCVLNHTAAAVLLAGCSGKSTQAPTQSASSRRHTSTQWACSAHPRECANAGSQQLLRQHCFLHACITCQCTLPLLWLRLHSSLCTMSHSGHAMRIHVSVPTLAVSSFEAALCALCGCASASAYLSQCGRRVAQAKPVSACMYHVSVYNPAVVVAVALSPLYYVSQWACSAHPRECANAWHRVEQHCCAVCGCASASAYLLSQCGGLLKKAEPCMY
jgi:hypothetical protein